MLDRASLEDAISAVGDLLEERGQPIEVVAIGGDGLLLLGLIERSTKDLDLVGLKVGDAVVKPCLFRPHSKRRPKTLRSS